MAKTLRQLIDARFVTKGSELLNEENDQTFIEFQDGIDANTAAIAAIPASHTQNTDQFLDEGGPNESSAVDIRALLDAGGADNFIGLTDTPASYSGQSGLTPIVNATEDGLEFIDVAQVVNEWQFDSATVSGPAVGDVRLNDTNIDVATVIYLSSDTDNGFDATEFINQIATADLLTLREKNDVTVIGIYQVSAPPVDNGGDFTINVIFQSGSVGESFVNNENLVITRTPSSVPAVFSAVVQDISSNIGRDLRVNAAGDEFEYYDLASPYYAYMQDNAAETTINSTGVFEDIAGTLIKNFGPSGVSIVNTELTNDTGNDYPAVEIDLRASFMGADAGVDKYAIQVTHEATPLNGIACESANNSDCGATSLVTVVENWMDGEKIQLQIANIDNGSDVTVEHLTIKLTEL